MTLEMTSFVASARMVALVAMESDIENATVVDGEACDLSLRVAREAQRAEGSCLKIVSVRRGELHFDRGPTPEHQLAVARNDVDARIQLVTGIRAGVVRG